MLEIILKIFGYLQILTGNYNDQKGSVSDRITNQNQDVPSLLAGVAPTSSANNDGRITGTNSAMEYKPVGGEGYTQVAGSEIIGLSSGDYYVRYAAKTNYNASSDASVTVPVYKAPTPVESTPPPSPPPLPGGHRHGGEVLGAFTSIYGDYNQNTSINQELFRLLSELARLLEILKEKV